VFAFVIVNENFGLRDGHRVVGTATPNDFLDALVYATIHLSFVRSFVTCARDYRSRSLNSSPIAKEKAVGRQRGAQCRFQVSIVNVETTETLHHPLIERVKLSKIADRIHELRKRTVEDIVTIGHALLEAKEIARHGQFRVWLDAEFGWSTNSAQNFMNVAEAAGKFTNFVHLNVPPSATYLLAAPSTRPEAVTAVAERSAKGERLSYHAVKDEIEKAKAFAPAKTPADLGYKDKFTASNDLRQKIESTALLPRLCFLDGILVHPCSAHGLGDP
jgi:hypothetical protein